MDHAFDTRAVSLIEHTIESGDDAHRHGPVQPKGVADSVDHLPYFELAAIADTDRFHHTWDGSDLEHRQIVRWICTHQHRLVS